MLREEQFDAKIKAALEQFEAPYEPDTWSLLENKMSRASGSGSDQPFASFDAVFKNTLGNLEAPFESAHWEQMSARIDRENRMRRRIMFTKLAEAAIFLLLIVNIEGMLSNLGSEGRERYHEQAGSGEPVASAGKSRHKSHRNGANAAQASLGKESNGFWSALESGISGDSNTAGSEQPVDVLPVNDPYSSLVNSQNVAVNLPQSVEAVSVLDPLPILSGAHTASEAFAFNTAPHGVKTKAPKQHSLYASLFVSPVYDQIHNGADLRKNNGFVAGVTVGYRKGKWGAETGLAYGKKTYQPKKQVEIYAGNLTNGYYGSYADQVSADVVSIPVHATRRVAKLGKTSVQALAGATAHLAVAKEYRYKTVFYPGLSPQPTPGGGNQPTLQQKGDGLLENGGLDGNFYATADAGIRVERPIGKRLLAYVEPVVQTAVTTKGVGPSNSKINSIGFRAGVIASL